MPDGKSLNHDPLAEADAILGDDFYGGRQHTPHPARGKPARPRPKPKPTHYKVMCISMYTKDIQELEAKVAELKRRGYTKANKSQLIRMALARLDLDSLPLPQ